MTETILAAESGIEVGHHTEAHWFGLTVNTDTVLATAIAAVIVLALAFFLRAKVTSSGVPGGVQLFWEAITVRTRNQIEAAIGMKIAPFVLPLAVTLFVFILVANWLSVFPVQYTDSSGAIHELLKLRLPLRIGSIHGTKGVGLPVEPLHKRVYPGAESAEHRFDGGNILLLDAKVLAEAIDPLRKRLGSRSRLVL